MRNQKHLSEIETSMAKQHFSRLPKIKQLRTENTAPCSEKSSPAVIRVLKIDPEIMNDNLFTFRIDEVEAFMKKTSNFPQSQQNSPKKVQRFPREVFTRKVKRTRL